MINGNGKFHFHQRVDVCGIRRGAVGKRYTRRQTECGELWHG
jgi:hypothetical protein